MAWDISSSLCSFPSQIMWHLQQNVCILHGQGSLGQLTLSKTLGNGSSGWELKGYHPSSCISSAFLEKVFSPILFPPLYIWKMAALFFWQLIKSVPLAVKVISTPKCDQLSSSHYSFSMSTIKYNGSGFKQPRISSYIAHTFRQICDEKQCPNFNIQSSSQRLRAHHLGRCLIIHMFKSPIGSSTWKSEWRTLIPAEFSAP